MDEFVKAVTGPLGALALSVAILVWLAKIVVPVLKAYLDGQNEKLGSLVVAVEKTVASHVEDRKLFEQSIQQITKRVDKIEGDVHQILGRVSP